MKLDYGFQVIRGYPGEGALDNAAYEVDATALASDTFSAGDVVEMNSNGKLVKSSATPSANVGILFRGPSDSASVGAVGNRAVVLWGNFLAKTTKYNSGSTFAPGTPITGKNGTIDVAAAGTPGTSFPDPVLGHVLEVVAASGSDPAYLVIVVK